MVTDQQVRRLRQKIMEGNTQETAAAASGMSARTARTWQKGALPSERKRGEHGVLGLTLSPQFGPGK